MDDLLAKLNSIKIEKDTKIIPGNIKSGVTVLGVTGELDSIPDGIFIQEDQPTNVNTQAIWLNKQTLSNLPSDLIPSDTQAGSITWGQIRNQLTSEQLSYFNSCMYHIIMNYNNRQGFIMFYQNQPNLPKVRKSTNTFVTDLSMPNPWIEINADGTFTWKTYNSSVGGNGSLSLIKYSDIELLYDDNTVARQSDLQPDSETGLYIDVAGKRYIPFIKKANAFDKVLDTSSADATAGDILTGKTAFVNNTKLTGTMPNNGALSITPSATAQTIPAGYTSGGTVAGDANLVQANIRSGVTIFGVEGNLEPDKPDQTKTVTPSATSQTIEPDTGYELSSVTVNPIPLNIYCQRTRWRWYLG